MHFGILCVIFVFDLKYICIIHIDLNLNNKVKLWYFNCFLMILIDLIPQFDTKTDYQQEYYRLLQDNQIKL